MFKRISTFFMALCLSAVMAAPMAVRAEEEIPAVGETQSVSGNDLEEPGTGGETEAETDPAPETENGYLRVVKTDADTGMPLSGASFWVYTQDGAQAGELVTGSDGTGQVSLVPGDYYLLEQCAPEGYQLSKEKYTASITGGENKDLAITNKRLPEPEPKTGTVNITVADADRKDKMLSGAVFSIYETGNGKKAGELMTGKDGAASIELPAGNYTIKETAAPEGYVPSDPIEISLQAGSVKELAVTNYRTGTDSEKPGALRITKRDSESGKRLKDAVFGIYDADTDNRMGEITTDRKGVAEMELEAGSYYLLELEAPAGYRLDEEKIGFHVRSGITTEKTIKNVREEADETEEKKETTVKEPDAQQPLSSLFSSLPFSQMTAGETQSEAEQTEKSKKTGTLQVINSAAGTGEKLSGQILAVYSSDGKKAGELTVKSGKGLLALPEGEYYLRERKSPSGFFGEPARIRFSITEGMATVVEITSERDLENTNPQDIIPKTGETRPLLPFGLSALCFLAAMPLGVLLCRMKKRHP